MPFTFSHPAIVLPFCKLKKVSLSVTGLVVGSIVPDFEFLIKLKETEWFGHTWAGIFVFDIPFAILLCFLFHLLIKNVLIVHLPKFLRLRFTTFISFNWKNYFKQHTVQFFLSVLFGIGSHIFLDAFTHADGAFVRPNAFFYYEIVIIWYPLPVYFVLQILTSLAGGLYILWFVLKMKKGSDVKKINNPYVYWISLMVLAFIIFTLRLVIDKMHQSFDDIIIAAIGSCLYALVIISLYYAGKSVFKIQ